MLQQEEWGDTIRIPSMSSDEGLISNATYYTLDKRFFDILTGKFDINGAGNLLFDYAEERETGYEDDDVLGF